MTQRIKAPVEPSLLVWARESAALTIDEAAQKIGIDAERLADWESEDSDDAPTVPQLRKLATVYKRPLAVLFLSEPPNELGFSALRDFRRLRPDQTRAYSPQLAYEIRAAEERRTIALETFAALDQKPPAFTLSARIGDDPEAVAAELRKRLRITLDQQARWRDTTKAFKAWREAVESAGVLVFALGGAHHQIPLAEARGFTFAERPLPVVVVNAKDRPGGRIFTLLHELAHVILGQTAIANEPEPDPRLPAADRAIEAFCNRVAAATLMPRDALLNHRLVENRRRSHPWSNEEISALAEQFSVSREALLLRLVELGRAEQALFQRKRVEFERQYDEEDEATDEGGFAPYRYQVLSHLGRGFARLILQGYYQNRLSLSTVAGYLGVQAKHVASLEQAAFSRSG